MSSTMVDNPARSLFQYLDDRGIRQNWLADRVGISKQYLTDFKTGRAPMPPGFPQKAAAALGVPVEELFPDLGAGGDGA